MALGALVQGIRVANRAYAGGWYDWLSPFSIMTGIALLIGYGLLGATWLIMKTEGPLQDRAYRLAWPFGLGTLALIGVVSLWTPFLDPSYMSRLVQLAQHRLARTGAAAGARGRHRPVPRPRAGGPSASRSSRHLPCSC